MLRYMDKWSTSDTTRDSTFHAPVYKYDYMTKDYCLGSMQGGIVQPIQQQSWSLVFNSNKPHNIITGLNPYVSADELGMFFPEYPSFMLERITGTKASYTSEDKWEGGSPYERIYQDKNVLVALYDLPDSEKYREIDLFIPDCLTPIGPYPHFTNRPYTCPSGWRMFECDSTLVGIYMFDGYDADSTSGGMRYRSAATDGGYIIVCKSLQNITKNEFVRRIGNLGIARTLTGIYSKGDDNLTVDISTTPMHNSDWLFRSPFLESKKGSGVLTIRYKGAERVLDFRE